MAVTTKQRGIFLGAALLFTLAAMAWLQQQESADQQADDLAVAPKRSAQRHTQPAPSGKLEATASQTEVLPDLSVRAKILSADDAFNVDLFKSHAWYVPPPPKPVQLEEHLEPVKPTAPPLPFVFFGRLENGPNGTEIFLNSRNKVRTVKLGQVLDAVWRLDKEDSAMLYFTYVPLNLPVTLSKSAKTAATANPVNDTQAEQAQPKDF